jgi:transcriptional regulator with XRE-family HTH domain
MDADEASTIGARARKIRRRRGLSLDVVAGLAGIGKQYLSMLELGERGFNRRGLLEDLAAALGCSVADLTGQPYLSTDRSTADALAALPSIRLALNDFGPMDVPDVTSRPLEALAKLADKAAPGDHTTTMSTGVITLCKAPADPAASPPGPAAPSARWGLILLA